MKGSKEGGGESSANLCPPDGDTCNVSLPTELLSPSDIGYVICVLDFPKFAHALMFWTKIWSSVRAGDKTLIQTNVKN